MANAATVEGKVTVGITHHESGLIRAESAALPGSHPRFGKGSVAFGINQNAALRRLRGEIASDNRVWFGYGVSVNLEVA